MGFLQRGTGMSHDLKEFEESLLSRDRDGVVHVGGIASVCTCGWVSPYRDNVAEAFIEHKKHREDV